MLSLLDTAKQFLTAPPIPQGGVLIDFTMGNGYDTLYLCSLVPEGKVYAFDVQEAALASTRARLLEHGITNAELILDSHAALLQYVKEPIYGGLFNLGWLPGSDRTVRTQTESTLKAVSAGLSLLAPGYRIIINVYPGHLEGTDEGNALADFLATLPKKQFAALKIRLLNDEKAPYLYVLEKYKR